MNTIIRMNHSAKMQAREFALHQPSTESIALHKRIATVIPMYRVTFGSAAAIELSGAMKSVPDMLDEMERQIELFYNADCTCLPDLTDTANVCLACQMRAADTEMVY